MNIQILVNVTEKVAISDNAPYINASVCKKEWFSEEKDAKDFARILNGKVYDEDFLGGYTVYYPVVEDRGKIDNALYQSVKEGKLALAKSLIEVGANVEISMDEYGYTPLHMASYNADIPMLTLLINSGSNINSQAVDGKTPLDLAIERHKKDNVIDLLIANGGMATREMPIIKHRGR